MNGDTQPQKKLAPCSHECNFRQADSEALHTLKAQFATFSEETNQRMLRVEEMVMKTLNLISMQHEAITANNRSQPQFFHTNSPLTSPAPALMQTQAPSGYEVAPFEPNQSASATNTDTNLRLELVGVESRWYTKRPFPDFEIRVVDAATGELFTRTHDWNVSLRLVSGHGLYVDHFLANPTSLIFPVNDGKAYVSGLKFLAVSSRNGGHFQFEVSPRLPQAAKRQVTLPAMRSGEVNILSERLKNECKAQSLLDLRADDPLVRVPGIGKKYAQKLAEQGLATIRDLARIDNSPQSRKTRLALLNSIRKDRGALTEAKLAEMLRQAKAVVKRETAQTQPSEEPGTSSGVSSLAMPQTAPQPTTTMAHDHSKMIMDLAQVATKGMEQLKAKQQQQQEQQQQVTGADVFASFRKDKIPESESAVKLLQQTETQWTADSEVDAMINFRGLEDLNTSDFNFSN